MVREDLERTIALADVDACVRAVEGIVADRDWECLLWFADRCRAACDRGFQLWPAAEYARYRAALDAPPDVAGQVLIDTPVAFGLGPLAEVAASTHTWSELAPFVPPGPVAVLTMYERVARGEHCWEQGFGPIDESSLGPIVMETPPWCSAWEPAYPEAHYFADRVDAPAPARPNPSQFVALPSRTAVALERCEAVEELFEVSDALAEVARAWRAEPEVVVRVVAVDGTLEDAVGVCGSDLPGGVRFARISGAEGVAHLAWAAASGGPMGRRRGMAIGREQAWHVAALAAGGDPRHGLEPEDVERAVTELVWAWWDRGAPRPEWSMGLAIADLHDGCAWALEVR